MCPSAKKKSPLFVFTIALYAITILVSGCQVEDGAHDQVVADDAPDIHEVEDDLEFLFMAERVKPFACVKASSTQLRQVNRGVAEYNHFLTHCAEATDGSPWCEQLVRPNPASHSTFHCTYSASQSHYLIHPDQSTWKFAYSSCTVHGNCVRETD